MSGSDDQTSKLIVEVDTGAVADADAIAGAIGGVADQADRASESADNLNTAGATISGTFSKGANALIQMGSAIAKAQTQAATAAKNYADGLNTLTPLINELGPRSEEAADALQGLYNKMVAAQEAADKAVASQKQLNAVYESSGDVLSALIAGMDKYNFSMVDAGTAASTLNDLLSAKGIDTSKYSTTQAQINAVTAALGQLAGAYDPLLAATAAYVDDMNKIAVAEDKTLTSTENLTAARIAAANQLAKGVTANNALNSTPLTTSQQLSVAGAPPAEIIQAIKDELAAQEALNAAQAESNRIIGDASATAQEQIAIQDAAAKTAASYGSAIDALNTKFTPGAAALAVYTSGLQEIEAAETLGVGTAEGLANARTALTNTYQKALAAITPLTEAEISAQAAQDALTASAQRQMDAQMAEADSINALVDKYDAAGNAMRTYLAVSSEILQAQQNGIGTAEQLAAALDQAQAAYAKQTGSTTYNVPTQAEVITQTAASGAPVSTVMTSDEASAEESRLAAITAKYDPLLAAQLKYQTQIEQITADEEALGAATTGTINARSAAQASLDATTAAIGRANAAGKDYTASAGEQQFAQRQLTVQFTQFFSQIATGQPIMTAAIQQGHQLADVAEATGVGFEAFAGAAKSAIGFLFSPVGLIVGLAAAAAGFVFLGVETDLAGNKLGALSANMRATRDDYDVAAASAIAAGKAFAQAGSGTTVGDATKAASTFAAVPGANDDPANLERLTQDAKDYAAVIGGTMPDAAAKLAQALIDPEKFAEQLGTEGFPGFTAAVVENITHLQDFGDKAGAVALTVATLEGNLKDASNTNISPLQTAIANLGKAFDVSSTSAGGFFKVLGDWSGTAIIASINALTAVIKALDDAQKNSTTSNLLTSAGQVHSANALTMGVINAVTGANALPATPTTDPASLANAARVPDTQTYSQGDASQVQTLISALATTLSVPAEQLTALQATEGKINPNTGMWETSSSGAVGAFQVLPSLMYGEQGKPGTGIVNQPGNYPETAQVIKAQGTDSLDNAAVNATAGSEYYSNLLKQFNGDVWDATLAYHYGPTVAQAFLTSGQEQPAMTADKDAGVAQANKVATSLGLEQGPGRGPTPATYGPENNPILSQQNVQQAEFASQSATNSIGTVYSEQQANLAKQATAQTSLDNATATFNGAAAGSDTQKAALALIAQDTEALTALKGQYVQIMSPLAAYQKAQDDANAILNSGSGAEKVIAQAIAQRAKTQFDSTGVVQDATGAAIAQADAQTGLTATFNQQNAAAYQNINAQTAVAQAVLTSGGSVVEYTNQQKALTVALATSLAGTPEYTRQVEVLTQQYNDASAAAAQLSDVQQSTTDQNTLAVINLETTSLGENADARQRNIDLLTETQKLEAMAPGNSMTVAGQQVLAYTGQIDDANAHLKLMQNSLDEVGSFVSSTFSTVGDDITQAFVQGAAAGVSFGSIMSGIMTQLLEEILKLAILNPILNAVTGANNVTLSSVGSALGAAGSGTTSSSLLSDGESLIGVGTAASKLGGSGGGLLGTLSSIESIGKGLYGGLSGGLSTTGIGLVDSTLNTGVGFIGSSGLLGSGTVAASAGALGVTSGDAAAAAADGLGGTAAGTATGAGLTVGGALGGIGGGFAAGTLANQYLEKGNQQDGEIGSGVGAVAGTLAFGPLGGLAGGLIGGLIGGAFGPQNAISNQGYDVPYSTNAAGLVEIGAQKSEGDQGSADATTLSKAADTFADQLNQILAAGSITASGSGNLGDRNFSIDGKGDAANGEAGKETTDPNSIFSNLTLTSSNADVEYALKNNTTNSAGTTTDGSVTGLQQTVTDYQNFAKNLSALLDPLGNAASDTGTLGATMAALSASYTPAIAMSKEFGDSTDALTSAYASAQAAAQAAADATTKATLAGFTARDDTATGKTVTGALGTDAQNDTVEQASFSKQLTDLYGSAFASTAAYASDMAQLTQTEQDERQATISSALSSLADTDAGFTASQQTADGQPEAAAMTTFEAQAKDQVVTFTAQLNDYLSAGIITTQDYYSQIQDLDVTLAKERLAIQQQYTDQAKTQLSSTFSSLESYLKGLDTSDASPLSPTAQYAAAKASFESDVTGAQAGDQTSIADLQGDSSTFLAQSKIVNGGGAAYTADYNAVLDAISTLANTNPDTLTANVMSQIQQTATQQMVAAIQAVQAEIAKLRAETRQATAANS